MFELFAQFVAAWNQVGFLLGGMIFFALGAALCAVRLRSRLTGARVQGTVVGVRRGIKDGVYYPVYRYVSSAGNTVEVTSDNGSSQTTRMHTGLSVPLLVSGSSPEKAMDAGSFGIEICGLVLAAVGVMLLYVALTAWPVTRMTWIALLGTVLYSAFHVRKWDLRRHDSFGLRAWRNQLPNGIPMTPVQPLEQIVPTAARLGAGAAKQINPVFAWILIIAGLGLCAVGFHNGRTLLRLQALGQHGSGVVRRLVIHSDSHDHPSYYPIVRFTDASGSLVEFQGSVGSNPSWHHVGEGVRVLYDPSAPRATAIIDTGIWNWLPISAVMLFAIGLVAVGLQSRRNASRAPPASVAPSAELS